MELPSLKILLLEDSPTDVLLLQNALEADLLSAFVLTHVERLADGLKRLQHDEFDVILTDLGLPDSTGLETFERLHEQFPNLPILVFSGNVDGSEAVRAVRAGAQDYLIKSPDGFEMAARSIRYAIERHRQQQALLESEKRYRQTLDNMMEGCQLIGYDWRYIYINDAAEIHNRRPREELLQKIYMDMWPGIENTHVFQMIKRCLVDRIPCQMENEFIYPDGDIRWFDLSIQPVPEGVFILSTDITSRKRAEREFRSSEERFFTAFHGSPSAQAITRETDMKLVDVNEAYCQLTGYRREDLIDHTTLELNFWFNLVDGQTIIHQWELQGYSRDVEVEFHGATGQTKTLLVSSAPIELNGEKCIISTALDITERKRAEAELRLYGEIMTNLSEGIVLVRKNDMSIVYANPRFEKMFGYEEGELIGKDVSILNAPTDKSPREVAEEIGNRLRETGQFVGEVYNIRKDGQTFWCAGSVSTFDHPLYGTVWITAQQDITARKLAEEHLRQSEEKYRLLSEELEVHVQQRTAEVQDLYDNAPIGYHSLDREGRFLNINQTELHWLGYNRDEIIGRPFLDIVTADGIKVFQENFPAFKQRGWVNNLEFEISRKDGTTFPVLANAIAIKDEAGNYLMSRSILFDNTEHKKVEIALRQSRDQLTAAYVALEKASRAKDEFLANMSHELRTPLNSILGMSEILLDGLRGPLNERQEYLVHAIENSGRHLLSLINDILDLSKIEAGQLEIHPKMISLNSICMDSLTFVREPATKKGLAINFQPDPAVTTIYADERYLKQILVNLLNNAVKFTPTPGKVVLAVHANWAQSTIDLSVSDTGIGISAADLQRLFQPFTQVDSSLTRQHEGTGLGLALVKRLIELHGGGISVSSEVGQGSCFTVSLPWQHGTLIQEALPNTDTEALSQTSPSPSSSMLATVLLAEDTETNILTIGDYLESIGYQLIYARTGREALLKAAEFLPDVILMDIQLPEMNGLEAISRLRADSHFVLTPIIAVTALVMPGDRERCLEAGATAYMSKPIRLKQLASLIRDLLDHR